MPISQVKKTIYGCDRCGFESEDAFARGQYMNMTIESAGKGFDGGTGGATVRKWICGNCVSDFNQFMNIEKTQTKQCVFIEAWIGRCKNDAVPGGIVCEHHRKQKCWSCEEQATSNCEHTSQFVCGVAQCNKHKHHSGG